MGRDVEIPENSSFAFLTITHALYCRKNSIVGCLVWVVFVFLVLCLLFCKDFLSLVVSTFQTLQLFSIIQSRQLVSIKHRSTIERLDLTNLFSFSFSAMICRNKMPSVVGCCVCFFGFLHFLCLANSVLLLANGTKCRNVGTFRKIDMVCCLDSPLVFLTHALYSGP